LRRSALRRTWVGYRHRGLTPQDVFIASYPKSGNTWLRFLIGDLVFPGDMGFDRSKALLPIVGHHHQAPGCLPGGGRLLKTHEPFRPAYERAIYLVRDPRDVALSYYHHQLRQELFFGSLEDFLGRFRAGRVDGFGDWASHVRSWIHRSPGERRLLVVRYEDLKGDAGTELQRIMDFVGLPASPGQVEAALKANTLERMQEKEQAATVLKVKRTDIPVVRSGGTRQWEDELPPGQLAEFDAWSGDLLGELGYPRGSGA